MMKQISFLILFLNAAFGNAQSLFVGTFQGTYNGDNIVITLQSTQGNALTGKMKDSQQNYDISATTSDKTLRGKAIEKIIGLTFLLEGVLNGSQLNMKMTLEQTGTVLEVAFLKQGTVTSTPSTANPIAKVNFPSDATHDTNLVGTWAKNENYSSGSGNNYMGSSFQQSMIFFADGTVGDGGSKATMSGSNYSGYSEGGSKATPGLYWYNTANQLYLIVSENGKTETLHLGKYYIEKGAMLITGPNGKKILLTKQ